MSTSVGVGQEWPTHRKQAEACTTISDAVPDATSSFWRVDLINLRAVADGAAFGEGQVAAEVLVVFGELEIFVAELINLLGLFLVVGSDGRVDPAAAALEEGFVA